MRTLQAVLTLLCAGSFSTFSHAATCTFDGGQSARVALKKGYKFSGKAAKGNPTCQVLKSGEILVISANSADAGVCEFSIFVPRKGALMITTVVLKPEDGDPIYISRDGDGTAGLTISLSATKGNTRQYRISEIEVQSADGKCKDRQIGEFL